MKIKLKLSAKTSEDLEMIRNQKKLKKKYQESSKSGKSKLKI